MMAGAILREWFDGALPVLAEFARGLYDAVRLTGCGRIAWAADVARAGSS
jgi:hypothetical protein